MDDKPTKQDQQDLDEALEDTFPPATHRPTLAAPVQAGTRNQPE